MKKDSKCNKYCINTDVSLFTLCSETFSLAATIIRILSPPSEHEPTCRFDGFPSYCDLHSRADQDPYGVVLWIQKLVPGFKRKTNRETSQEGGGGFTNKEPQHIMRLRVRYTTQD